MHHQDESRHVAFGRQIFTNLLGQVAAQHPDEMPKLAAYLEDYLQYSIGTLYNPAAYRDAGIPNPLAVRKAALAHEARARGLSLMIGCMVGTSLAMAPATARCP